MRSSFAIIFALVLLPTLGAAIARAQDLLPHNGMEATAPAEPPPQKRRQCMSAAETREAVGAHGLIGPLEAVRDAQALGRGELLRSRLCRWDQEYVYELTLLKHDGHVLRVFLNAKDGRPMPGKAPG